MPAVMCFKPGAGGAIMERNHHPVKTIYFIIMLIKSVLRKENIYYSKISDRTN